MRALNLIPPDEAGIAYLEIDLPGEKVNKLSSSVMNELKDLLDGDLNDKKIRALVVSSAKPGVFIAGADISEIETLKSPEDAYSKSRQGQAVFNKLEALPYPTIAVIDGACLGGGLELALACSFRAVTDHPKTKLGLPEVSLGILPGWGGTQRLPRLIGLVQALQMILSGKPVSGSKAVRLGLADVLVPHEFMAEKVRELAGRCLKAGGQREICGKRGSHWTERVWPASTIIIGQARTKAEKKSKGHYPAIPAILSLLQETSCCKLSNGQEQESCAFSALAGSPVSRNLIGLFHTDTLLKKDRGIQAETTPRPIRRAAVLGAGVMGGGIAWLLSQHGRPVRVKDVSWEAVGKAFAEANDYYRQLVKLRKMKPHAVTLNMHRITGTLDYSGFSDADIVIEAIVEKMAAKKAVLAEMEKEVADDAIICSNTSALSISEMATVLKHPERFVGMHFFNPVNRMPLVEVVAGKQSSAEAVATVVALVHELKKTPVVVKDSPGFLVNRILLPYMNEAALLVQEGVGFERIDKLAEGFGMPMGPFALADVTGVDVGYKVIQELETAFSPRLQAAPVLDRFIQAGLLGRKTGGGFYIYKDKQRSANPEALKLLENVREKEVPDDEILDRLILVMLNEAAMCLQEGVIGRVDYLDMALITGIGFPPFRGGLMRYADDRGLSEVMWRLENLRGSCGERFAPCGLLKSLAAGEKKFYDDVVLGKGVEHGQS